MAVLFYAVIIGIDIFIMWLFMRLNRRIFKKIQKKRQGLHLKFFERVSSAAILFIGILLSLSSFGGFPSMWQSVLGGTAVISAVAGFAAQDVIKDILAGLMISLYRPIEIGNRVELEDGSVGIVKDITMRHVVLLWMDTAYIIIPNSKFNAMKIVNYSFRSKLRSARFTFIVGLQSDIEEVGSVIKEAVISSELSVAGYPADGEAEYTDVYFMAFTANSVEFVTTVYYDAQTRSEVLISDINTRVTEALRKNNIEIPYMYVNIIEKGVPTNE